MLACWHVGMLACWHVGMCVQPMQPRMYSVQLDANVHSIRLAQITRRRRGHDRKLLREAFKNADHCGDAPFSESCPGTKTPAS